MTAPNASVFKHMLSSPSDSCHLLLVVDLSALGHCAMNLLCSQTNYIYVCMHVLHLLLHADTPSLRALGSALISPYSSV